MASKLLDSDSQSPDVTPLHVNPHQCHLLASKLVCTLNLMKRSDICDHERLFHELQAIADSLIDLCESLHRLQKQPYKLILLSQSQEAFAVILSKLAWYATAFLLRRDFLGILSQTLPDIWHLELREAAREDCKAHAAEWRKGGVVRIESEDIEVDYRRPIGQGACGRVYEAKWLGEWRCAVKEFNDATNVNEANVLASLHHPNIVQFYGTLEESALVMELMDFDLTYLFRGELGLDLIVSVDVMLQAAEGMRYLHEADIVHRDLKAANILIKECAGGSYLVKLTDFGLARTKVKFVETEWSYKAGTLKWRAPELLEWICEDRLHTDPIFFPKQADVYSFGITCSEILTRKSPYTELENTPTGFPTELLREKILEGRRPLLPSHGVPAQLVALIERCWDRNPDRRPSFKAICLELKQIKASLLTEQHFSLRSGGKCTSSFDDTDPAQEVHQFYRTVSYSALRL